MTLGGYWMIMSDNIYDFRAENLHLDDLPTWSKLPQDMWGGRLGLWAGPGPVPPNEACMPNLPTLRPPISNQLPTLGLLLRLNALSWLGTKTTALRYISWSG